MAQVKVDRCEQLVALCRWHQVVSIAELGVLHGKTTKALLKNLPEINVFAIDTWVPGDPALDPGPEIERRSPDDTGYRSYSDVNMAAALQGIVELKEQYTDRLVIVREPTLQAATMFPEASLDAIFLDADHTYEAVKADLMAWIPKIRAGGMVFGHDYAFASVNRALDEVVPGWKHHHAGIWSIPRDEIDPATPMGADDT